MSEIGTIDDIIYWINNAYRRLDPGLKVFVSSPYNGALPGQPELAIVLSNNRRMCLRQRGPYYQWDMLYVRKFFRVTRKLLHRQLLNRIGLKLTDIWAD